VRKDFQLVKKVKVKAGVRSLCMFNDQTLLCGENEGWIDLVRVSDSVKQLDMVLNKRFDKLGHIYLIQKTSQPNTVVVCSYSGVHFIKVYTDPQTLTMSLHLSDTSYITDQFVNKVVEFSPGKFLASVWDSNRFIVIDHEQERIAHQIIHPHRESLQTRCWGLVPVPGFDIDSVPFVFARDNTGIVLINVKELKAYIFSNSTISENLYGHGDILRISGAPEEGFVLWTVV
jgi:hypothetical protein